MGSAARGAIPWPAFPKGDAMVELLLEEIEIAHVFPVCHSEERSLRRGISTEYDRCMQRQFSPILTQVPPIRIHRLDQRNLLRPSPTLDLFLSPDGSNDVVSEVPQ